MKVLRFMEGPRHEVKCHFQVSRGVKTTDALPKFDYPGGEVVSDPW